MSEQAQALADRFQRANRAVIEAIEGASDEQLHATCEGENCTVASLGYHVGSVHGLIGGWVRDMASGKELPPVTQEMVHAMNAEQFPANANRSRDEVLGVLRENGREATDLVRGLSDEELAHTSHLTLIGREVTTADLIEMVLIYDVESHLPSIRAAIERAG
jgi:cytochrome P450